MNGMTPSGHDAPLDWTHGVEAIRFQSCNACGKRTYFQRGFCPQCGSTSLELPASQGVGSVYALTEVVRAPSPAWKALAPYPIVLVDLDEGVRIMAHAVAGLAIDDRVRIDWLRLGERLIPRAVPLQSNDEVSR